MTDAVDREENGVGVAYHAGQQAFALLQAAIVVQQFSLRTLHKLSNAVDLPRTATDIEESRALEVDGKGVWTLRVGVFCCRELCFDSSQFLMQLLCTIVCRT